MKAPDREPLYVWFEPWAEGLRFPPGSDIELRGASPIEGELEIDRDNQRTAVYGWPGSILQVIVDGTVVRLFDTPVPGSPTSLSTKEIVTMLFDPAPTPEDSREQ